MSKVMWIGRVGKAIGSPSRSNKSLFFPIRVDDPAALPLSNKATLDPNDKGHVHAESAEFWLVFTGQIRYAFEGQAPFVASEGDVSG